jgi:DNA-binding transcriptional MerR regulator
MLAPLEQNTMEYTVKRLSKLAGVSVRTLHFYDEIGLLRPARVAANGYRYYGDAALLRLQQILFYKELGLSLDEIAEVLDQPEFDVARALEAHRRALQQRLSRLRRLMTTVDQTIAYLIRRINHGPERAIRGL